jgi:hypothetical protein
MTYTIRVIGEARPEAKRQRFFRTKAVNTPEPARRANERKT